MAGLMGGIGSGLSSFMDSFNQTQRTNNQRDLANTAAKRQTAQDIMDQNKLKFQQEKQQAELEQLSQQNDAKQATALVASNMMQGKTLEQTLAETGINPATLDMPALSTIAKQQRPQEFAPKSPQWAVVEGPNGETKFIAKGDNSAIPEGWSVKGSGGVNIDMSNKAVPTEKVRMLTISDSGLESLQQAENLFFDKDGNYNANLAKILSLTPDQWSASGALGQDASQLYTALVGAVQDKLRLETGAAITKEEAAQSAKRYLPGPFDDAQTAAMKMESLRRPLQQYNELGIQGTGKESKWLKNTEVQEPQFPQEPSMMRGDGTQDLGGVSQAAQDLIKKYSVQ